jgi:hypothetical protein
VETASLAPSVVTEVTAEDVFRFSWYHIFHEPNQRCRVWISYLVVVTGGVWNLAYQLPASLVVLIGAAIAGAAPFLYRWQLRSEAHRAVRIAPENYGTGTMQLLPEGVRDHSDQAVVTFAWTVFKRIVATPEAIYFYRGQATALIVPRRCFASSQAAEAFITVAQQYHAAATRTTSTLASTRSGTGR